MLVDSLPAFEPPGSRETAMLVCQCNGVSDRAIRKAVRKGAKSVSQVGSRTGAATCCGGCLDSVKAIIRSESGHSESKSAGQAVVSLPIVSS